MAKAQKIYNFDFGTVEINNDEIQLKISKDQFQNQNNLTRIEELITDSNDNFLPIEKVIEEKNSYIYIYKKIIKSLKPLNEIKSEEYPVKASIAETILKQDVLNEYAHDDVYISLNPATIFYYPMETVRYTYAGNQFMPRTEHTTLSRYQACIASIFSGIPYEKCLKCPKDVQKEGNDLIKAIYEKNSRAELLEFVSESNNFITYNYIANRTKDKKKSKNILYLTITGLFVFGLGGIIGTQLISNSNQLEMAQAYEQQLEKKDYRIEAERYMVEGEYEKAIPLFKKSETDLDEVANRLLEKEQYQLAVEVSNEKLEKIIQIAYENDEKEIIENLQKDNLDETTQRKLENEQTIISGDTNAMQNVLSFLDDENTAVRLAQEYNRKDDLNRLEQIQEQYPNNTTISKLIDEKNQYNEQIQELETAINDLEQTKADTDDEDEIKDIDKEIETLQKEIEELNS